MSILVIIDTVLIIIILGIGGVWLFNKIQAKRLGGALTNEEFKDGMRKAQIVDLRENNYLSVSILMVHGICHIPCLNTITLSLEAICPSIFIQIL